MNEIQQKDLISNDARLVSAVQKGNKEAFDQLVLRYQDKIFNLCYCMMGDYHEAEECAQKTFIRAYNGLKNFEFRASFYTWLYRIAVNTCKNRLREQCRNPVNSIDNEPPGMPNGNPSVLLERKERAKLIRNAVNTLPEDRKTVIILRDIDGLSYEEITEITGLKIGTVKSKLSRARDMLREILKKKNLI